MIEYTSSRLCFKADLIEPLKDNDVFVVHTLNGTFKFTKADFYRVFSNVIETKSYQKGRLYSCKYPPKRALPFLISGQKQGDNNTNKQTPKNVHKTSVPQKDIVGDDIRQKIKEIGILWRNSPHNPLIDSEVVKKWENLIEEWVADETMPLIIRKETSKRGQAFNHPCGREIIVSDNTVAIWVLSNVLKGKVFTLSDIKELLQDNELPMVFMATKEIKAKAKYTKSLGSYALSNWKVCHIQPVGFNARISIESYRLDRTHFPIRQSITT